MSARFPNLPTLTLPAVKESYYGALANMKRDDSAPDVEAPQ